MSRAGRRFAVLIGSVALVVACAVPVAGARATRSGPTGAAARERAQVAVTKAKDAGGDGSNPNHTPDDNDLADNLAAYSLERSLPAASVTGAALLSARNQQASLASSPGTWNEVTTQPYNAAPADYTDPFWSNVGSGFSLVGGRVTSLVTGPGGVWFAGAADGGVWRSTDQGRHWQPIFDSMPQLVDRLARHESAATSRCGSERVRRIPIPTPTKVRAYTAAVTGDDISSSSAGQP